MRKEAKSAQRKEGTLRECALKLTTNQAKSILEKYKNLGKKVCKRKSKILGKKHTNNVAIYQKECMHKRNQDQGKTYTK